MIRTYLCIDLKTFYASVECVERGLDPFKTDLIVADLSRTKGTICLAISPKMKARGIKNRCRVWEIPSNVHPIVAKPRMKLYIKYSSWIYSIYLKYVSKEDIHPYSIDEMFLDVTDYLNLYKKSPTDIANMIMNDIFYTTGITATVGIGTNLYLAKVALDIVAKHSSNNIGYLDEQLYQKTLWHHLPLTDFWRINHAIERRLHKLHLNDMYDIAHADSHKLYKEFGLNARFLIDHAIGIEPCTIADIKKYRPKNHTISSSQILHKDYDMRRARNVLVEMVDDMVNQLVKMHCDTSYIGLCIGYTNDIMKPLHVSFKLEQPTCRFQVILKKVLEEFNYCVDTDVFIRRIGISFGNVRLRKYEQLNLFVETYDDDKDNALQNAVVSIKNKYGKNSLLRAISYVDGATQLERNKLIGGHNAE